MGRQIFTASDTFVPPEGVTEVDVLVVGGGASGGAAGSAGGGGGAGAVIWQTNVAVSGPVAVTVGEGGARVVTGPAVGNAGQASSFGSITANGGGGGGAGNGNAAASGACGGGGTPHEGGPTTAGLGLVGGNGGAGSGSPSGQSRTGGGGGGMGGNGSNGVSGGVAGEGGSGIDVSALTGQDFSDIGENGWLAGGGGGGGEKASSSDSVSRGFGRHGGGHGGLGRNSYGEFVATDATFNTGSGGGGSSARTGADRFSGAGGSGLVVVLWDDGEESHEGAYANAVAQDNPYQWFRFREADGATIEDASGYGRYGTLIGSPNREDGLVDKAIVFNGSSQAAITNIAAFGSYIGSATFELMIATTDTRQERYLTGYSRSVPPRFAILQNDSGAAVETLHFEYRPSDNVTRKIIFNVAGAGIWDGTWHHLVFVADTANSQGSLYINGVLHSTVTSDTPHGGTHDAWTVAPYIGARDNEGAVDGALTARFAEVAWYDYQLSPARIAAHFAAADLEEEEEPELTDITYEASGSSAFATEVSTWSFTPDSATKANDVLVVQVANRQERTYDVPAGGTMAVSPLSPSNDRRVSVFTWVAPTDNPGTVNINASGNGTAIITWSRFRGVSTVSSVRGSSSVRGFPLPAEAPSFMVPVEKAMIVGGAGVSSGSSSPGTPVGWELRAAGTSIIQSIIATKGIQAEVGPSGAALFTDPADSDNLNYAIWQLALAPTSGSGEDDNLPPSGPVSALVQTDFLPTDTPGTHKDIVDDPAIWVNPDNPSQSVVLGSNKNGTLGGVHVYDLSGNQLSFLNIGETNNVDLRDLRGRAGWDDRILVVGSNRTHHRIDLMWLSRSTRTLSIAGTIPLGWSSPYCIGMHVSAATGEVHVMVCETGSTESDLMLEQFRLTRSGDTVSGTLVRSMTTDSQCEGIAGDDKNGYYFIGEEDAALLRYDANSTDPNETPYEIDRVASKGGSGHLHDDIEGIAIAYDRDDETDYLIVSSQGSSQFIVYDLDPPHAYRKTFWVQGPGSNNVADTDGIEITRAYLGPLWPNGLFVCHDNHPLGSNVSNFKFVDAGLILGAYEEVPIPDDPYVTTEFLQTPSDNRWSPSTTRVMWQHEDAFGAVLPTNLGHYIVPDVNDMNTFGPQVIADQDSRVDVRYHEGWLGVLVGKASLSRFFAFDATNGYSRILNDISVPVGYGETFNLDATPVVLHRANNGHLWVAAMTVNNILITRSTDGGASWQATTSINTTIGEGKVGFASSSGNLILIASGNEGGGRLVMSRLESNLAASNAGWTTETLPTLPAGVTSDDHLSIAVGPDGTVYAASKTSGATTSSQPLLYLLKRTPAGVWLSLDIEVGPDTGHYRYTRPSLTMHSNGMLLASYGNIHQTDAIRYRSLDTTNESAVFSSRQTLITGGNFSDGVQALAQVGYGEYPILVHDRDTSNILVTTRNAGDEPVVLPFGYLGDTEIIKAYLGSTEITGLYKQ